MSKHDPETLGTNYANSGLRYFNDFHQVHRRRPARHDLGGERFTVLDLLGVIAGEEDDNLTYTKIQHVRNTLMDAQFQAARNRHPAGKGLIAA